MKKGVKNPFIKKALRFGYLIFFGGLAALILVSCNREDSDDVNQDKIWTEYIVHYDKNDDTTHAVARFRFGSATGTLLELVNTTGASVTFNESTMPYSVLWSGHHLEFAGNVTTGIFEYTNTAGTTYTNSIPTGADTIAFPSSFNTVTKSVAETFVWDGNPLAANESVGIYVGTFAWDREALFYTEVDGASSVVFGVNQKSGLTEGAAIVYMQRSIKNTSINGTSEGGIIRYQYRTINKSVTIAP